MVDILTSLENRLLGRTLSTMLGVFWRTVLCSSKISQLSHELACTMIEIAQNSLRRHLQRHDDPLRLCDSSDDEMVDI